MAFRVPVLETFLWQKEVLAFVKELPTDAKKGDRYIISKDSENPDLASYKNYVAWYDGTEWGYDEPHIGWTTIVKKRDEDLETDWQLMRFDGTEWNLYTVDQLHVDSKNFKIQIPKTDPDHKDAEGNEIPWTLQHLLEWMDRNVGGPGPLGVPPDKTYSDGLFDWTEKTKVNEAIDDTNEAMKDLAPAKPDALTGLTMQLKQPTIKGYLSDTLNDNQAKAWLPKSKPAKKQPDPETGEVAVKTDAVQFLSSYVCNTNSGTTVVGLKPDTKLTAGTAVNNVITSSTVNLFTSDPVRQETNQETKLSGSFSYADKGILKAMHIAGSQERDPEKEADLAFDIGANYYENDPGKPRFPRQNMKLWFQKGAGAGGDMLCTVEQEVVDAIPAPDAEDQTIGDAYLDLRGAEKTGFNYSSMTGSYAQISNPNSYLRILEAKKFNGFNLWQKGVAEVQYKNLEDGYHAFYLSHMYGGSDYVEAPANKDCSNALELFYDADQTAMSNPSGYDLNNCIEPVIKEISDVSEAQRKTFQIMKTVSGITYYTVNAQFKVDYTVENQISGIYGKLSGGSLSPNIFNISSGCLSSAKDYKANQENELADPPVHGSTAHYKPLITANNVRTKGTDSNISTADLSFVTKAYHPYKNSGTFTTTIRADKAILYNANNAPSTIANEYFEDEKFRLTQTYNFDTLSPVSDWDSSTDLSEKDDAVIYLNKLQKSAPDLSNYYPVGNKNHLPKKQLDKVVYYRWFNTNGKSPSSITLTFDGVSNLGSVLKPANTPGGMTVEVKLPGPNGTGWTDAGSAFFDDKYKGLEGDGCQTALQGNVLSVTFGKKEIDKCGYTMYIRVTLYSDSISINKITTNW